MSGARLADLCRAAGLEVIAETVSDDREAIAGVLKRLADAGGRALRVHHGRDRADRRRRDP